MLTHIDHWSSSVFFDAASQEVPLEGGNAGTPSHLCYFSKALSWSVAAWGLRPRNEHGKADPVSNPEVAGALPRALVQADSSPPRQTRGN